MPTLKVIAIKMGQLLVRNMTVCRISPITMAIRKKLLRPPYKSERGGSHSVVRVQPKKYVALGKANFQSGSQVRSNLTSQF